MRNKCSLLLTASLLIGLSVSCKKSSDPGANTSCSQQNITDKANAYSAAVTTWSNAPTNSNCKAVVVAYDNYLSVAQNCSFVTQADITTIQQARADINKLCQ